MTWETLGSSDLVSKVTFGAIGSIILKNIIHFEMNQKAYWLSLISVYRKPG